MEAVAEGGPAGLTLKDANEELSQYSMGERKEATLKAWRGLAHSELSQNSMEERMQATWKA